MATRQDKSVLPTPKTCSPTYVWIVSTGRQYSDDPMEISVNTVYFDEKDALEKVSKLKIEMAGSKCWNYNGNPRELYWDILGVGYITANQHLVL